MFTIDHNEPQPMDASHQVQLTMAETKEIIHQLQSKIESLKAEKTDTESDNSSVNAEKIHMIEQIIKKLRGL